MAHELLTSRRPNVATLTLSLAAVTAAGAVTGWYAYRLQIYHMPGLPAPEAAPPALALSAIPTALFLIAVGVGRRSVGLLVGIALAAAIVAVVRVSVISGELAAPWTRGTGLVSLVAWGIGVVVAFVFAGVAVFMAVRRGETRGRPAT